MKNFLELDPELILDETKSFVLIEDQFPVSTGHILIVSKKLKRDFFSLSEGEQEELAHAINKAKKLIEVQNKPEGFNIGMNCGAVAGQTVMHFHCHVIPRYKGDMEDPRGGVRHVIPSKGNYLLD
jgi:diadenosine tetraphosphate (Ap4A) HIT family hydrolase